MGEHARLDPDSLPAPTGYAHALRAGETFYLSGQVALDADRNLVGRGDMRAQTEQTFANLSRLLESLKLTWADVAKLNIYLTDMDAIPAVREVRANVYAGAGIAPPATTTVGVTRLAVEHALIEVEAIAVRCGDTRT